MNNSGAYSTQTTSDVSTKDITTSDVSTEDKQHRVHTACAETAGL